jgi:hypothetical protein
VLCLENTKPHCSIVESPIKAHTNELSMGCETRRQEHYFSMGFFG